MDPATFYRTDWVAEALIQQCVHRYVTLRFDYGLRRHYSEWEQTQLVEYGCKLWRPAKPPFIEIHSRDDNGADPLSYEWFVGKKVLEFIPEVSTVFDLDRTDTVIIDLDPKDPKYFTFEDLKSATKVVYAALCTPGSAFMQAFTVEGTKLRFSGNRSFHIYIKISRPYPFDDIRKEVKKSLDVITKMYPQLTYKNYLNTPGRPPKTDYILVDIGALSRHRCVRALYSLHHKTNLVCVPVADIDSFQREWASPDAVLSNGYVAEAF